MKAGEVSYPTVRGSFFWVPRSFSGLPVVSCRARRLSCLSLVCRSLARSLVLRRRRKKRQMRSSRGLSIERENRAFPPRVARVSKQEIAKISLGISSSCSLGCFAASASRNWNCYKIWASGSLCLCLFCRRRFCGLRRIMEKGWGLGNDARLLCGCAVTGSVHFVMKA